MWAQDEVTVSATANANEWTFEMPDADVEVDDNTATLADWNGYEADLTLTLNFKDAATLVAGKPYLVKAAADVENPTFDGVTVSNAAAPTETEVVDFIPTVVNAPEQESSYMKGFRAYFQLKGDAISAARAFSLNMDDGEATGVQFVATESQHTGQETCDLQGRKVSSQFTVQS
jgi:hypothetical protein